MRMRRIAAVSFVALALPAVAAAQWRVTPFGGVYVPTADVAKESVTDGGTTATATMKQKTGFILGANANTWFSDRAGFEFGAGYVFSDLRTEAAIGGLSGGLSKSAWLVPINAKLLLRLSPPVRGTEFYFGVGPTVILAGGTAYNESAFVDGAKFERGASVGGVGSVNFRYQVTPMMALKLGAESHLYSTKIKYREPADPAMNYDLDSKFQSDFMFTGGLSFTLPKMSR